MQWSSYSFSDIVLHGIMSHFYIKDLHSILQERSSSSRTLTYRDFSLLKVILCSGLYPQVAIADEHNGFKKDSEQVFHTRVSHLNTRPQWVNSLGPSDAIWRHKTGSTLAQVMACCLMAPSHYLSQCWLIISKIEWHSSKGKFTRDTSAISHWN